MRLEWQMALDDADGDYAAFTAKFKPKKTTDDCLTPKPVYDAVLGWVAKEYGVNPDNVVRPFWPGGDYEKHDYPDGCVVVDNPPFSIIASIVRRYSEAGIKFFLFAPYLSNLNIMAGGRVCHVITGSNITYENGAAVATSFVTNLDGALIYACPELAETMKKADQEVRKAYKRPVPPKYKYSKEVITATQCGYMAKHGVQLRIMPEDAAFITALDSQMGSGKSIFGGGFLLSEKAAAEKAAAEKAAAEKAAAKRAAAEKAAAHTWELSDREREIVKMLGRGA